MPTSSPKAIILLSGGVDSTTLLALAKHQGFDVYTLSFAYNQCNSTELTYAKRASELFGAIQHLCIPIQFHNWGHSTLVQSPRSSSHYTPEVNTYVPARNTIFLSYALAWAEILQSNHIFIGVNALDYTDYPDCRPSFISAFEQLARVATEAGVKKDRQIEIHAPLIEMEKAAIIQLGLSLGVDFSQTQSCYQPNPQHIACGQCDSCKIRLAGFAQLKMQDPIAYQT